MQVVLFNTADAYEPTVDHVGNSSDAAAATCHCVASLIHRVGARAAKDFAARDGVAVVVRVLQTHRGVLSVVANGCHALAAALACAPALADACLAENVPYLALQLMKAQFAEPVVMYWAATLLAQVRPLVRLDMPPLALQALVSRHTNRGPAARLAHPGAPFGPPGYAPRPLYLLTSRHANSYVHGLLAQVAQHEALRGAVARTVGVLSLLVRASEAYRGHPRCAPVTRQLGRVTCTSIQAHHPHLTSLHPPYLTPPHTPPALAPLYVTGTTPAPPGALLCHLLPMPTHTHTLLCTNNCHRSVAPRLRELYDAFATADAAGTATTTGRAALALYVSGGMGNHYLGYWDVAMGGVDPPTKAGTAATAATGVNGASVAADSNGPAGMSFASAGALAQYMGLGAFEASFSSATALAGAPPGYEAAAGGGTGGTMGAPSVAGTARVNPAVAVYPAPGALGELEDYGEGGVDDGPQVGAQQLMGMGNGIGVGMGMGDGGLNQHQQQLYQIPMATALTSALPQPPSTLNANPYGQ